jgi:hypothetical protein
VTAGERHVIGSALFELEVPDDGPPVADYVQRRLLALAEDIFDEFDEPGRVIRIERLELDLGATPGGGDWRAELERRFGEELRAELHRRRAGASVPSSLAELDVLAHVLRTGTLPWAGGWGEDGSLDAFARRVILAEPRGFARWLRSRGRGGAEVRRLVRQTSDETLAVALAALSGVRAAEWRHLLGRLDWALREGTGLVAEREAMRRTLLDELVRCLAGEAPLPGDPDPRTPSGEGGGAGMVARLHAALRTGVADVAGEWDRALASGGSTGGAGVAAGRQEGPAAGGETAGTREAGGGASGPSGDARDAGGDVRDGDVQHTGARGEVGSGDLAAGSIARRLEEALRSGVLAPLLSDLSRWVRSHPGVVAAVVGKAASDRRVRRVLAGALSDKAFLDVLGVLEPGAPEEVRRVLDDPTGPAGVLATGAGSQALARGVLRRLLREFTLAHLVVDAPRRFRSGEYREALRLRLAAEGSAHRPEGTPVGPPQPALGPQEPPPPYASLHRLVASDDVHDAAGGDDLGTLLRGHPDDLLRLLEGLRRGGESALERIAGWPAARVWKLTDGLLAAVAGEAPDGGRELRRAVAAAGGRVADPRGFHLGVIRALVEGGWIDLDRLQEVHGTPVATDPGHPPRRPEGDGIAKVGAPEGQGRAGVPGSGGDPRGALALIQRLLSSLVASAAGGAGEAGTSGTGDPMGAVPEGDAPPASRELRSALELALAADATGLRRLLERALADGAAVDVLVRPLPGPTLARVLLLLRPGAGELLRAMDAVAGAVAAQGIPFATVEREKWRFLLRYLVMEEGLPEAGGMARALLDRLLTGGPPGRGEGRHVPSEEEGAGESSLPAPVDREGILEAIRVRVSAGMLPTPEVGARVLAALSEPPGAVVAEGGSPGVEAGTDPAGSSRRMRLGADGDGPGPEPGDPAGRTDRSWSATETLFVSNAGIVLAAPYLPSLFDRLQLTAAGAFRSGEHAGRAVHLVQYLVEGRVDRPEYLLPLNKLLCGLGEDDVIPSAIELAPGEEELLQGLLSTILQHWGALGNTTVQGLQESFFQREGALRREGEAWRLQVEARPFDMLIDRIRWSFSVLRFGWMDRVLHVDWRG